MRLRIEAEQSIEQGDPKEHGRPDTRTTWDFGSFHVEDSADSTDDMTVHLDDRLAEADVLYAVIAIWSTGDSFGREVQGSAEIISVHDTPESAQEASKIIYASRSSYGRPEPTLPVELPDGYQLSGYIPWNGHFDTLEYVDIVSGHIDHTPRPS